MSSSAPDRWTLLQEGGEAFARVVGGEDFEEAALELGERRLERQILGGVESGEAERDDLRALAGDRAAQRERLFFELFPRDGAVDEPDPRGLDGGDLLTREHHLEPALATDVPEDQRHD